MGQQSLIGAMALNTAFSYSLPIAGVAYLAGTKKRAMKQVAMGAAVFLVFQILLRLPLREAFSTMGWQSSLLAAPWVGGILTGIMAGTSEEVGRWLGLRVLLPKGRGTWVDALAFGIGHGGLQSVSLNLQGIAAALTTGAIDGASLDLLLGGLEQIPAMMVQIALSFIVMRAINRKKIRYLALAILLRVLADAPLALLPALGANAFAVQVVIALEGIAALIYVARRIKRGRV